MRFETTSSPSPYALTPRAPMWWTSHAARRVPIPPIRTPMPPTLHTSRRSAAHFSVSTSRTAGGRSPPPKPARRSGGVAACTVKSASVKPRTGPFFEPATRTTVSSRGATTSAFAMSCPGFGQ